MAAVPILICTVPISGAAAGSAAAAELERLREENEALRAALLAMRNEFLPEELREGAQGCGGDVPHARTTFLQRNSWVKAVRPAQVVWEGTNHWPRPPGMLA